jgi:NADH/NAD ratio-sensing transcriptional regulator Rex
MTRICPACGGSAWEPFLQLSVGCSLTSDQQVIDRPLDKVICADCGLVRNRTMLGGQRNDEYKNSYKLNTTGTEEHTYFTERGPVARSQAIFDWIQPYLPKDASRITEIGCGMGNLLLQIAKHYLHAAVVGIEGNRNAADLARAFQFDIRQQLVGKREAPLPVSDLVVAYGVAEHVEDLEEFFAATRAGCHADTTLVLCVPIQDHGGYDVFFSDHIWHFTLSQFKSSLMRAGFDVLATDASSGIVRGFGLVAARLGHASLEAIKNEASTQNLNRDTWKNLLVEADKRIQKISNHKVAVYGASEVFSLLLAYTGLGKLPITACLDEDLNKVGTLKHGIPVHHPRYLESHPVDTVLLTVNPRYNDQIRAKLAPLGVPVMTCLEGSD